MAGRQDHGRRTAGGGLHLAPGRFLFPGWAMPVFGNSLGISNWGGNMASSSDLISTDKLLKTIKEFTRRNPPVCEYVWYCHPNTAEWLRVEFETQILPLGAPRAAGDLRLYGVMIEENPFLPEFIDKEYILDDPFVDYEGDMRWARACGMVGTRPVRYFLRVPRANPNYRGLAGYGV